MKPSEKFAGWQKKGLDNLANGGESNNVLRQALKVNPELKGNKSTEEFLVEVATVKGEKPGTPIKVKPTAHAPRPRVARSVAESLALAKEWVASEESLFAEELANIEAELDGLRTMEARLERHAKARIEEAIAALDPNRASPVTQAVLNDERAFLTKVGVR